MDLQRPLGVVTPTLDADVLAVLARADAAFTGREVHRLIPHFSESGVRRVLGRLVEQGIVTVDRVGRSHLYRLNRAHLAAPHIEALARLGEELVERLRARLAGLRPASPYAAIFGSSARGEGSAASDIDVLVVRPDGRESGDAWDEQLDTVSTEASAWMGNDLRFLVLDRSEAESALPLMREVRRDEVRLVGSLASLGQPDGPGRAATS